MSTDGTARGARREYDRVADVLRHENEHGAIAAGDQLPMPAELKDAFDISCDTFQKAIKALEGKGYVESAQSKDVFARDSRKSAVTAHINWTAAATVEAGSTEPDDAIAEAFEPERVKIDAYCLPRSRLSATIVTQAESVSRASFGPRRPA